MKPRDIPSSRMAFAACGKSLYFLEPPRVGGLSIERCYSTILLRIITHRVFGRFDDKFQSRSSCFAPDWVLTCPPNEMSAKISKRRASLVLSFLETNHLCTHSRQ